MAIALDGRATDQVARAIERHAAMPLVEAVSRRLGVESWLLRLDADGRLRTVVVLAPSVPSLPDDAPPPPPPPEPAPEPDDPLERSIPLPAGGALARMLGASRATGRQLADLALHHDDPGVRGEAVAAAVDAVLRDPGIEERVLGALDGLDDASLARSLTGIAGDAAEGLVSVIVERAHGHRLGARAMRVLARLHDP